MKKERPFLSPENNFQKFGFTDSEILYYRLTHERFLEMVQDPQIKIHAVSESGNAYGEFLFVTISKHVNNQLLMMTFYGLGYHQYRDRWFTDEWHWYQSNANLESCKGEIGKEDAVQKVEARRIEVLTYAKDATQSEEGCFFEILADLTDDDGAIAEFEDLIGFWG